MRFVLVGAAGFAVASLMVAGGLTRGLDRAILDAMQPLASVPLDLVSSSLSAAGGTIVTAGAALALTAWSISRRDPIGPAPLYLFVGVAIELLLKRLIDQPAPPEELLRDAHWLAIGGGAGGGNAFPSGHVARGTFLCFVVASRWPAVRWIAGTVVALLAFTRVYSASHWASDVVGGLFLGLALGGIAIRSSRS